MKQYPNALSCEKGHWAKLRDRELEIERQAYEKRIAEIENWDVQECLKKPFIVEIKHYHWKVAMPAHVVKLLGVGIGWGSKNNKKSRKKIERYKIMKMKVWWPEGIPEWD